MKSKQIHKFKETEIGNIPSDWQVKKLEDLSEKIFTGRDPKGGKLSHSDSHTGFRLIRSGNVFDGYLVTDDTGNISEKTAIELSSAQVQHNDVLLNQLGDGITFARSCLVRHDVLPAYVTRSVGVLRVNNNLLDPRFLNAYLVLPSSKKYIESFNSGTSRRAIDGSKMKQFLIPLPNMKEQKWIGDFYENNLEQINHLKKSNFILENIIQSIFKSWFVDFDGQTEFVDSKLGQIPKGWEVRKIGDVCDIFSGGTPSTKKDEYWNGNIPWFSSGETRNDFIIDTEKKITQEGVDNSSTRLTRKGDILIASAGQGNTRGQVSLCLIDTYINQSVLALRSKNKLNSIYLFCNLRVRYDEFRNVSDSHSSRGSLPKNLMTSLEILVPKENILKLFDNIALRFIDEIETNMKLITKLNKIRDYLLPKLMSGEIRV